MAVFGQLNTYLPLTILQELCLPERNGHFPFFYNKYLKNFRKICLYFDDNFTEDIVKWKSISNLLLSNIKNLKFISITIKTSIPSKFQSFLFSLFENSKFTLINLFINFIEEIISLPLIQLPNLTEFSIIMNPNYNQDVDCFESMIKNFVDVLCPSLKLFKIHGIDRVPQILKYITKNYPSHFVCGSEISILNYIPLKISHLNLENISQYSYAFYIEYLIIRVENSKTQSERSWNDNIKLSSFFPNLK